MIYGDNSISVLLNVYKREHMLNQQIESIKNQSIPIRAIYIWVNNSKFKPSKELLNETVIVQSNYNFGVWARLAFAFNLESEFISMIDDDTIPGSRWFENCLETIEKNEGLLGTRGLRYKSKYTYSYAEEVGWKKPNENIEQVDIVGHNWFFRKSWLSTFWQELPSNFSWSRYVGEDLHFSYTLQKYLNINTYVPPHPQNDLSMWGSTPTTARELGEDINAISKKNNSLYEFEKMYKYYIGKGYKLTLDSSFKNETIGISLNFYWTKMHKLIQIFKRLLVNG